MKALALNSIKLNGEIIKAGTTFEIGDDKIFDELISLKAIKEVVAEVELKKTVTKSKKK